MTRKQLTTGIAVGTSLVIVGFFFAIFNPLMISQQEGQAAAGEESGQFIVQDELIGNGEEAQAGDFVTVDYTGKLQNGTVFDSSIGKQPIQFTLGTGRVIPGWDQGLQGMKVGGKRLLIIPPSLAYGPNDYGPIPGGSTLIFEVTLVGVQKGPTDNADEQ
ncbi:FKBP-type peptidyl-prolyl cis-trans isomerase [Patescibacteria group bacterium]|nr:FKBP-type peptidyl-prolyl cis-trans isomerase [Patescibacteria group bacterium]